MAAHVVVERRGDDGEVGVWTANHRAAPDAKTVAAMRAPGLRMARPGRRAPFPARLFLLSRILRTVGKALRPRPRARRAIWPQRLVRLRHARAIDGKRTVCAIRFCRPAANIRRTARFAALSCCICRARLVLDAVSRERLLHDLELGIDVEQFVRQQLLELGRIRLVHRRERRADFRLRRLNLLRREPRALELEIFLRKRRRAILIIRHELPRERDFLRVRAHVVHDAHRDGLQPRELGAELLIRKAGRRLLDGHVVLLRLLVERTICLLLLGRNLPQSLGRQRMHLHARGIIYVLRLRQEKTCENRKQPWQADPHAAPLFDIKIHQHADAHQRYAANLHKPSQIPHETTSFFENRFGSILS